MPEEFINVEGIGLKDLITIVGSYLFNGNDIDTIDTEVLEKMHELVELELEEIKAIVNQDNIPSQKLIKKLGFKLQVKRFFRMKMMNYFCLKSKNQNNSPFND